MQYDVGWLHRNFTPTDVNYIFYIIIYFIKFMYGTEALRSLVFNLPL